MPTELTAVQLLLFPLVGALATMALAWELWQRRQVPVEPLGLLLFSVVVFGNLEQMAIQLGGGSTVATTNAGGVTTTAVVAPGLAKLVSKLAWLIAALACAACAAWGLTKERHLNIAGLAVLLAALSSNLSAFTTGSYVSSMRWNFLMVIFASITLLRPSFAAVRGAALGLSVVVLASLWIPLVNPDAAANTCGATKCGVFGNMYHGATFNENALGLLCALGLPLVWFGLKSARWPMMAAIALALLATGSRTSMATGATGLLVLLAASAWPRGWRISFARASALLFLLLVGISLSLPFLGLPDPTFTGRARLWRLAREQIVADPARVLWGQGPESWPKLFELGIIDSASSYSAHNQFITVLFTGGVVSLLLLLSALVVAFVRNSPQIAPFAATLVPALVATMTERPWALERPDWMVWGLCALVAMAPRPISHNPSPLQENNV